MLKKYKHISFDLDGTLVHTVPEYRHEVVPQVVDELNGVIKDIHAIDRFWFEAGRDETIRNEFNLNPEDFWPVFQRIDTADKRSAHTRAYIDSESTLRKLKEMGKVISIVTGAPHWIAEMEIKKLNGAPHDYYLSLIDKKYQPKPNPDSLNFVLNETETCPAETLYIGNSNEDAYFAKNAGVDFIYLERKEHNFDLKDYVIAVIHSLDDLFILR